MGNICLNIFLSGLLILLVAIFINFLAESLGLSTWYNFLKNIRTIGISETLKSTGFLSYLFLFFIYPFCLGAVGYLAFILFIRLFP